MKFFLRKIFALCFIATMTACGGGSGSSTVSSNPTTSGGSGTTSSGPTTLAADSTFVMPAGASVLVPAGTVVSSSNGNVVTINGSGDTVNTQAGAVVRVPAGATGPANNTVTTNLATAGGASTAAPKVTALAGSPTTTLAPADGIGAAAVFWGGGHLAVDASGNVIVSDRGALRKVTQAGVVTTLSNGYQPDDWEGIAIDSAGNIYGSGESVNLVSTNPVTRGASVNKLTASGALQNLFSNWETSSSNSGVGYGGLAVDSKGNLFLADGVGNRIIKFSPDGNWTVFAGSGVRGNLDGVGTSATFTLDALSDLVIDANDNLFVSSMGAIRKIVPDGTVTTVNNQVVPYIRAIALDQSGNFYLAEFQTIYRVSSSGTMTSFAFPSTTDVITSMATDKNGNLYVATQGVGAQIFKISF